MNSKFYIGVHKTADEYDEYLGSGKILRASVRKYGRNNFRKMLLLITYSAEEAYRLEATLVEGAITSPLCMNLREGGTGGFDYINRNGLQKTDRMLRSAGKTMSMLKLKLASDQSAWNYYLERYYAGMEAYRLTPIYAYHQDKFFKAAKLYRNHPPEVKERISKSRIGRNTGSDNHRFGRVWITNGVDERTIQAHETVPAGWYKGRYLGPYHALRVAASMQGRKWISSNGKSRLVPALEAEKMILSGWIYGRC